jgi:hypothetical protein
MPRKDELQRDLAAAEKLAMKNRMELVALKARIEELGVIDGTASEVARLKDLRTLQDSHDYDCRRIRQELAATID